MRLNVTSRNARELVVGFLATRPWPRWCAHAQAFGRAAVLDRNGTRAVDTDSHCMWWTARRALAQRLKGASTSSGGSVVGL